MLFGERTANALLELGAFKVDPNTPFIYASRKIGPVYIDVRRLSSRPDAWAVTVQELVDLINTEVGSAPVDLISGGEIADLLFSIPVALHLAKPHLIIRKVAKGHGLAGRLVGTVAKGQHVLHVADLLTHGTSAVAWVEAIRGAGGQIRDYVVVFDRMQGGARALNAQGVQLHALLRLDERFLALAAQHGLLSKDDQEVVASYRGDPEAWARTVLRRNPRFLQRALAATNGYLTRREGLEILTRGYPDLIPELGAYVAATLKRLRVQAAAPEVGYAPSASRS
jgi:orotate phosphoribosyltransferase